jgi:transposase-like protein
MARIVPSERLRQEVDEVLAGVGEHDDPVEAVARIGARLIMQQALEDEVTEFLERERYARAGDGVAIYRNGYEPRTVKTTSGPMELEEHDVVYLYLDAIYLKLRPDDEPAEGVLVAWGLTLEGQKVLLGLALGSRES